MFLPSKCYSDGNNGQLNNIIKTCFYDVRTSFYVKAAK